PPGPPGTSIYGVYSGTPRGTPSCSAYGGRIAAVGSHGCCWWRSSQRWPRMASSPPDWMWTRSIRPGPTCSTSGSVTSVREPARCTPSRSETEPRPGGCRRHIDPAPSPHRVTAVWTPVPGLGERWPTWARRVVADVVGTAYGHDVPGAWNSSDAARETPDEPLVVRAQAPDVLPPLPETGGLTWRALTPADAEDLTTFIAHIEEVDNPPYRTSPEEVAD